MSAVVDSRPRIGRFAIVRELGRGAQGAVYLADDQHLERQVALKTVSLEGIDDADPGAVLHTLLAEARIVSKLQHPNLVTLHDALEERGEPCLVFEYVEGRTLSALIREQGRLAPAQAAKIAHDALLGVACAHAHKVLHRDLKPANVMITAAGVPRVMDFGIACRTHSGPVRDGSLAGTPAYMAPEYISEGTFLPASDVFAMGVVLYEMLTGRPPAKGASPIETLNLIVHQAFAPPSSVNPAVDERLDALVMKALAKDPEERYAGAGEMARAIDEYLAPAATQPGAEAKGTLEFLLRRMRHKSDFPALSSTISAINRVVVSDREPTGVLCSAILKDVSLTSKLLKLVNAAYYAQYGGAISTVSRAVTLLGFEEVRNIAMSLMLLEHLQNKTHAGELRDELLGTYMSGLMARDLARRLGVRDAEEAFICAMMHRLGRLLVLFYLHDEHQAIERLAGARGWDEARAAKDVLGMGYEDIGIGVARTWNFPASILDSMRPVAVSAPSAAQFEGERLRMLADLSNSVCDALRSGSEEDREQRLKDVVKKYGRATGIGESTVKKVVAGSLEALARDGQTLGPLMANSALLGQAHAVAAGHSAPVAPAVPGDDTTLVAVPATRAAGDEATLVLPVGGATADQTTQLLRPAAAGAGVAAAPARPAEERRAALSAGVQDIINTLVGKYELNDVLRMMLETIYRGIGFQRVLLCVRDAKRDALRARLGFGEDAEAIIRAGFAVPLNGKRDIFYAAVTQHADICIQDLSDEKIRRHVPDWYREAIKARGMLLLPIALNGRAVGLVYADVAESAQLRLAPEEMSLLKTLRNQAVLAMRQAG